MRQRTFVLALLAAACLLETVQAGDGCNGCHGYPSERMGFLGRLRARFSHHPQDDPARACTQGKTHLDMGCTPCKAYTVFVFGSCCEFFEHPETFQGPVKKCCSRWRGGHHPQMNHGYEIRD